ncbi:MAG TPA: glycosyltransferase family 4 protein [Spongiibacteraceae bacterium]|jgi:glycosyltransferase involved in cell wall biosynthesis|nr:glycosyltransferase family 4 protein [Spongiibacteraceae bacterium]
MDILQIVASGSAGGLGKHVIDLSNALASQHRITVVCDSSYSGKFGKSVDHIHCDLSRAKNNPLKLLNLFRLIKRIKPHVIHVHGNSAATSLARLRHFMGLPIVGTIHWELTKKRELRIYERLNFVIGVNAHVLKDIANKHTSVVHNGVRRIPTNVDCHSVRDRFNLPKDARVGLAIGRLVQSKGFDTLITAWADIDATLLIVGDGPQRAHLESLADHLGLGSRILFAGHVDDADEMMAGVDLVIVSSQNEGFGYVIAEALMNRKPLVCTSVEFARTIMPPTLLAEPSNVDEMRRLIKDAFSDLQNVRKQLYEAYNWAEENLSVDCMANRTVACYTEARRIYSNK